MVGIQIEHANTTEQDLQNGMLLVTNGVLNICLQYNLSVNEGSDSIENREKEIDAGLENIKEVHQSH